MELRALEKAAAAERAKPGSTPVKSKRRGGRGLSQKIAVGEVLAGNDNPRLLPSRIFRVDPEKFRAE